MIETNDLPQNEQEDNTDNNNQNTTDSTVNENTSTETPQTVNETPSVVESTPESNNQLEDVSDVETEEEVQLFKTKEELEALTLEGLVEEMVQLVKDHPVTDLNEISQLISKVFDTKHSQEEGKAKAAYLLENGVENEFRFDSPIKSRMNTVLYELRNKKRSHYKKQESEQQKNLERRLELIEDLKNLYQHQSDVDNIFKKFREIKTEWSQIGYVPKSRQRDVYNTYRHHLNNFYEYLEFNKELREKEYSHNLELRLNVINRAKQLLDIQNVNMAFNELQYLHKIWKEDIGPVDKEHSDLTWDEFKAITSQIHDRKAELGEQLKATQEKNLEKRYAVLEEIKELAKTDTTNHGLWTKTLKRYEQLREDFISIKNIPRHETKKSWNEFKEITREFNKVKNTYFKNNKKTQKENLAKKLALIEIAKELKTSTDIGHATNEFKRIQTEWKQIGATQRSVSDKIWKEFRDHCNEFFDKIRTEKNSAEKEFENNTTAKLEILKEINDSASKEATTEQLDNWMDRWNAIGKTLKSKRHLEDDFKSLTKELASKLGMKDAEYNEMLYRKVVDHILNNRDLRKLSHEIHSARKSMEATKTEISQLETNIGFFGNADKTNPMLKGVFENIENKKAELANEESKYRYLRSVEKELSKQEEEQNQASGSEEPESE